MLASVNATKHDFPFRDRALAQDQLPAIKVYTPNDQVLETKDNNPVFAVKRQLTILIECVVKATENVAAEADILSEAVLTALFADDTLNGLVIDFRLDNTVTETAAEGEIPVAKATMSFDGFYWQDFSKIVPDEDIPLHVWLGFSPDIGTEHVDDYVEVFHDPSAPPHP